MSIEIFDFYLNRLSHNDLAQLFRKALESNIPFGIYFATSDNKEPIFDITKTREYLEYEPMDGTSKT